MTASLSCERCGGSLVSIAFTINGEERTMHSCSKCDHRTWLADGSPIGLGGVLEEISHERRMNMVPRR